MEQPSVDQLTRAIASGDTEAFAVFYRAWFDRLYREARRATRQDESFCLDVVQDAMFRAMKSMTPMDSERRLAGWLRTVVRSCAIDRLRSESRRRRRERQASLLPPVAGEGREGGSPDPDHQLVMLQQRMDRLDDAQRLLLHRRYRLGWTLQRIGAALGLSPGAVDGRIRRLVRELRKEPAAPNTEPVNDL